MKVLISIILMTASLSFGVEKIYEGNKVDYYIFDRESCCSCYPKTGGVEKVRCAYEPPTMSGSTDSTTSDEYTDMAEGWNNHIRSLHAVPSSWLVAGAVAMADIMFITELKKPAELLNPCPESEFERPRYTAKDKFLFVTTLGIGTVLQEKIERRDRRRFEPLTGVYYEAGPNGGGGGGPWDWDNPSGPHASPGGGGGGPSPWDDG